MSSRIIHLSFFILLIISFTTSSSSHKHNLREKESHLHFYFHDSVSGRNPTAVPVAKPAAAVHADTFFGYVVIMDDPLTEGPDPSSRPVGRAQGMYAGSGQDEVSLLMNMNLAFTAGKYKGSVLTVLGRNRPQQPVREMPIVGGSGLFRFARGYVLARTHFLNLTNLDAIVEYHVHVIHY